MAASSKSELRRELKAARLSMDRQSKADCDGLIAQRFLHSEPYERAEILLIYVSGSIEVGTESIIETALSDGKAVFAPRCISGTNDMVFCRINGFDELEEGYRGIREPKEHCPLYSGGQAVCVVPALAYDGQGYRLGFGKGFYDRFLSGFSGITVGICYEQCLLADVCREAHDVPVDRIITEKREIITKLNERNDRING